MSKYRSILSIVFIAAIVMFIATIGNAAVEITSFTFSWPAGSNSVVLNWQTGSEFNIGAFHVWRSTTNLQIGDDEQLVDPNGNAVKLTSSSNVITASCSGNTTDNYTFTDSDPALDPNVTYYYYIEAIRCQTPGSGFYGDGQPANANGNGLEVSNGNSQSTATPLPTNTPSPTPIASSTPTPSGATLYLPVTMK